MVKSVSMTHDPTYLSFVKNSDFLISNSNSMDSFLFNYKTLTV